MQVHEININQRDKSGLLFFVFSVWSIFLVCRPQDYIAFLGYLRPGLTLELITLLVYAVSAKNLEKKAVNRQFKLYMYLVVVILFSVPFSYYRSASLTEFIDYCTVGVMFFVLFYQIADSVDKLRKLIFVYCAGVAIYAVNIFRHGAGNTGRLSFGTMFDPNDTAFFIISFLTLNFIFIAKKYPWYIRLASIVNVIIGLIVILKTGSRGGFIALIAVSAVLLFAKTNSFKISYFTKIALVVLSIASLQFVSMDSDRYKTIMNLEDDYNLTGEEGRVEIWKKGIGFMLSRPLTGIGMNRFNEGIGRERERLGLPPRWQTAHNSLVQIGAETGVFGLILFCVMSFNAFKIFGQVAGRSQNIELARIGEMSRAAFLGHFISAMFISQAYSIYWIFYIVLSAVLKHVLDNEAKATEQAACMKGIA